jgi:hypothetical protein
MQGFAAEMTSRSERTLRHHTGAQGHANGSGACIHTHTHTHTYIYINIYINTHARAFLSFLSTDMVQRLFFHETGSPRYTSPRRELNTTAMSSSLVDGAKDDDFSPTPCASRHFSMADMQNYYLLPAAERDKQNGDAAQGHLAEDESESEADEDHGDASMSQASLSAHSDTASTAVALPSTTVAMPSTPKGASTRRFSLRVGNLDARAGMSPLSAVSAESRGKDLGQKNRRKSSVGTLK